MTQPTRVVSDAFAISSSWLDVLSMEELVAAQLATRELGDAIDVVGIGKAAREMTSATRGALGDRVRRQLVICDADGARRSPRDAHVLVGEHPLPGLGSRAAARALVEFLHEGATSSATVFLISGGASSLCNLVQEPLGPSDLEQLWRGALRAGLDITTLNKLRAATSKIAGGLILREVSTATSLSLILVDNVVSGAPWVASALTYDVEFSFDEVDNLIERFDLHDAALVQRVRDAAHERARRAELPVTTVHDNVVLATPSQMLEVAIDEARHRGYEVCSLGAEITGEACEIARELVRVASAHSSAQPLCVIGAGEATVSLSRGGVGGRCQELAWASAPELANLRGSSALVARASDGRDHVANVAGAWADADTLTRLESAGLDWSDVLRRHDTNPALATIEQLIPGEHTGWNLCDLYVLCVDPRE